MSYKVSLSALAIVLIAPVMAFAQNGCVPGFQIKSLSHDGAQVTLNDNSKFTVLEGQSTAQNSWKLKDQVVVCPESIINTSDDYSKVVIAPMDGNGLWAGLLSVF